MQRRLLIQFWAYREEIVSGELAKCSLSCSLLCRLDSESPRELLRGFPSFKRKLIEKALHFDGFARWAQLQAIDTPGSLAVNWWWEQKFQCRGIDSRLQGIGFDSHHSHVMGWFYSWEVTDELWLPCGKAQTAQLVFHCNSIILLLWWLSILAEWMEGTYHEQRLMLQYPHQKISAVENPKENTPHLYMCMLITELFSFIWFKHILFHHTLKMDWARQKCDIALSPLFDHEEVGEMVRWTHMPLVWTIRGWEATHEEHPSHLAYLLAEWSPSPWNDIGQGPWGAQKIPFKEEFSWHSAE